MPSRSPDPLARTDRLLIDGTNLLHALRRGQSPAPAAALIGRLRGTVPPEVGIELVLDGPPEPGMRGARIASGVVVRYAGRRSADEALVGLVDEASHALGGARPDRRAGLDNILVVTDDRDLRTALQAKGVRTAGTAWLIGRLERRRLEAPGAGNRRSPSPTARSDDTEDQRGWRPGRGATAKRGNPKRGRRPPA